MNKREQTSPYLYIVFFFVSFCLFVVVYPIFFYTSWSKYV